MEELSTEAKVLMGSIWSLPCYPSMEFKRPHIITEKMRKALDDLTECGFLSVEEDRLGGLKWTPTEDMKKSKIKVSKKFVEEHNFPMTTEGE